MPSTLGPPAVTLTEEQRAAAAEILKRVRRGEVITLGGYAGTGKTTVIRDLINRLPDYAVVAYTGKAANVLRRKGVADATTIHRLLYTPVEREYHDDNDQRRVEVTWEKKTDAERRRAVGGKLRGVIVDEASMVDSSTHDDLLSLGVPVVFVGDHGQLPPVSGSFNLMESPQLVLETIHRNAGEIARFAEFIRLGNEPSAWLESEYRERLASEYGRMSDQGREESPPAVSFLSPGDLHRAEEPDQIIVAFNRTRVELNRATREHLGFPAGEPVVGDRVMCLQNDHRLGVFNGMQGRVAGLDPNAGTMLFNAGGDEYLVRYHPGQFNQERKLEGTRKDFQGMLPFDYCYAVTCHKAQGDEWDHVLVFEQRCGAWEMTRWSYTAASRARRRLDWVVAD